MIDIASHNFWIALAVTTGAGLATGIGGFARGGEFNRRNGNRLMRWRIIAQAVAIAVFLFYLWMRSG